MNTKFFITIAIVLVIAVSTYVVLIISDYPNPSLYPEWFEQNKKAAYKIINSPIPIIGVDVDERPGILTIYMTEENANKHTRSIDNLIDSPYQIVIQYMTVNDDVIATYYNLPDHGLTKNEMLAQNIVDAIIEGYDKHGQDLSWISDHLVFPLDDGSTRYVFVMDPWSQQIVAHPNPEIIGKNMLTLIHTDKPFDQIMSELNSQRYAWIHYNFTNPDSGQIEPKTSVLRLYDGLIFGSGFYLFQ